MVGRVDLDEVDPVQVDGGGDGPADEVGAPLVVGARWVSTTSVAISLRSRSVVDAPLAADALRVGDGDDDLALDRLDLDVVDLDLVLEPVLQRRP